MSTLAYFAIPKALHEGPYQKLSIRARYLYGLLRDRHSLSARNGWRDSRGIFVVMSRASAAQLLGVSVPTARKAFAELACAGLISELRMGLTRCNKIYVQPVQGEAEIPLTVKEKEKVFSGGKPCFSPEGKPFAPNVPYPNKPNYNRYKYRPEWGKKTVLAQQYTQRDYRKEDLQQLIEVI